MADLATAPSGPARQYLPTTRNNAISMLAGGLATPAIGLDKYYQDILSLAPGRLVLTSAGARPDWFTIADKAAPDIPVLLELATELTGDECDRGASTVAAVPGVVPVSRLSALHFVTNRQADEFLARRYDNVDPASYAVRVSPGLFNADVPALVDVRGWLAALPAPAHPTAEDIRTSDALAGATQMALICPASTPAELHTRRLVLECLLGARQQSARLEDTISEALAIPEWLSPDIQAEQAVLHAVVEVLAGLSPTTGLGVRRVLADVRAAVDASHEIAIRIDRNLRRVESILKAEEEIRPLTERAGLRSAKALLLFLLRPSPDETPSWSDDMPGDPRAILGACVFSGLAAGMRLLPATAKRGPLCRLINDFQADRANAGCPHIVERFAKLGSLALKLTDGAGGNSSLQLGAMEVARTAVSAAHVPPIG